MIEARLSPLSADARTVTRIAATLGREFTLSLLLRVSPLDEMATLRGLDEARRRRLVRERGDGGSLRSWPPRRASSAPCSA